MPPKKKLFDTVDWDAVGQRLPTNQDPTSREDRKALFKKLDSIGNGTLSLTEVQQGIPVVMGKDLIPGFKDWSLAIKCAFNCARDLSTSQSDLKKGKHGTDVDAKEFHALLVAFRKYLELYVIFDDIDTSKDKLVTLNEVLACEKHLTKWGIDKESTKRRFKGSSTELKFEDFAEWCILRGMGSLGVKLDDENSMEVKIEAGRASLFENAECKKEAASNMKELENAQNQRRMLEAFQKWDLDQNGFISEEELTTVLMAVNPKYTPEMCRQMLIAADKNNDGKVDYQEFCAWVFKS
eukprot:gnl/TRDRNA2_/TRDRNA2_197810_c0_seq1.p1 gnl/TRDRNA2_/TRDRNA2_197810_c0~~gnl/TRDRNA2_/TRDRNA2_197810_c0_seq1.p1  ORF type:complete len:320 (+),score=74.11 gnl/TRDRNA2_/TRDRNA2_197810_c0_seq1:77-961(+)